MKFINALSFRQKFGSVLDEVVRERQPVTVTRGGRPLVVLVPAEDYEALSVTRRRGMRRAVERLEEWRATHAATIARLDPVDLLRRDRADR
ncbi:MAG: type II toxin-antitoxin system Phd/YefM family antitoxin [Gemmatimonadetes bacterium]|nr:type II toxin-antitoxin system Phd/YefM family antitoxin [Gemmatimonadota bacterium]